MLKISVRDVAVIVEEIFMNILRTVFLCLIFISCYLVLYRFYILKKSKELQKNDKILI